MFFCTNSTGWCQFRFYKNGTELLEAGDYNATAGTQMGVNTVISYMNGTTDYMEAYTYVDGTTVAGTAVHTRFTGTLIAPVSAIAGGWSNDGTQSYLSDSNDKVGIGTTTPYSKLTVTTAGAYASLADSFVVNTSASPLKMVGIGFDSTLDAGYIQATHDTVAVKSLLLNGAGGNVGIGTTSPISALNVYGTTPKITLSDGSASANLKHWFIQSTGGVFKVGTTSDALTDTATVPFSISSTGFGTTTLSGLAINGSATSTSNVGFNITSGCFAVNNVCVGSGNGTVNTGTTGQFPYYAANGTTLTATSTLFLNTNSRIGIATSSPLAQLDVYGDTIISGANRYLNFGATSGTTGYGFRDNSGTVEFKNTGGDWTSFTAAGTGGGQLLAQFATSSVSTNASINFNGAAGSAPSITYSSGVPSVITLPSNTSYIVVETWGAGGGGAGAGIYNQSLSGSNGGQSCFGTNMTACTSSTISGGGGSGAQNASTPPAGGSGVGGDINIIGGAGGGGSDAVGATHYGAGGSGGSAARGGGGGAGGQNATNASVGNVFGGGGGGGGLNGSPDNTYWTGNGGAGGGYAQKIVTNPSGTYYYTVGAGGAGGSAGTSGSAGAAGGAGGISISVYTTGISNGSLASGTAGQFAYYNASGTNLSATSSIFIDTTNARLGIGTTSPNSLLNIAGSAPKLTLSDNDASADQKHWFVQSNAGAFRIGTTSDALSDTATVPFSIASSGFGTTTLSGLNISGQATSTSNVGFNITSGCFAVNNVCVGGGSGGVGTGTTGQFPYYAADGTTLTATSTLFLATSGKVGIGTTTPQSLLSVGAYGYGLAQSNVALIGNNNAQALGLVGDSASANLNFYATGTTTRFATIKGSSSGSGSGGWLVAYTSDDAGNITERMRIDSSGNVGIGTTSPSQALRVAGTSATTTKVLVTSIVDGENGFMVSPDGVTGINARAFLFMGGNNVDHSGYLRLRNGNSDITQSNISMLNAAGTVLNYITNSGSSYFNAGNVGIGTADPGDKLQVQGVIDAISSFRGRAGAGGATANMFNIRWTGSAAQLWIDSTNVGTIQVSSDERLKQDIQSLSSAHGLAAIRNLNPVTFLWKDQTKDNEGVNYGFIAQEAEGVLPDLVHNTGMITPDTPDGIRRFDYQGLFAPIVKAIQELDQRTMGFVTTTEGNVIINHGNLGIGTTSPAYKLHVNGEIAAEGFINASSREFKTDITGITAIDEDTILATIASTSIAHYRYKDEDPTNPLRIGLIAEEAPSEILSSTGKGVDVYQLATFTLAGVKAQQRNIESLDMRVAALEEALAATSTEETGENPIIAAVNSWLSGIGIAFSETAARFNNLAASAFTVGSKEKPSGITLYDEETGEAYCVKVKGGQMVNVAGTCEQVAAQGKHAAPTLDVQGNDPATIEIGAQYNDLGVIAKDWRGNDLSIRYFVNGAHMESIIIDTASSTTYSIEYSATDTDGLSATSTRTVIVGEGSPTLAPITDPVSTTTSTTTLESTLSPAVPPPPVEEILSTSTEPVVVPDPEPVATSTPPVGTASSTPGM